MADVRRRVPRWVLAVVAVALVVAAVDVAVFALAQGGTGTAEATPTGDAVGVIDPVSGHVVARLRVGRQPTAIRAGYGAVWVLNKDEGTLTHIDPHGRKIVGT